MNAREMDTDNSKTAKARRNDKQDGKEKNWYLPNHILQLRVWSVTLKLRLNTALFYINLVNSFTSKTNWPLMDCYWSTHTRTHTHTHTSHPLLQQWNSWKRITATCVSAFMIWFRFGGYWSKWWGWFTVLRPRWWESMHLNSFCPGVNTCDGLSTHKIKAQDTNTNICVCSVRKSEHVVDEKK